MKTYILRDPNAVEPQKVRFLQTIPAADPKTVTPTGQSVRAGQARGPALFVGLDGHTGPSPCRSLPPLQ